MEMHSTYRRYAAVVTVLGTVILAQACRHKSAVTSTDHVRGTVESLEGQVLTVATASGSVRVQLEPSTRVGTVVPSDRDHITGGSFLGITSVTGPDGSERAVEVHVFPEAMRGSGEGSYPWDFPGSGGSASRMTNGTARPSRMTNGTLASSRMTNGTVSERPAGSALTLQYKDGADRGSRTITIPSGIPIVAIEPGQAGDLRPGTHVFIVAHRQSGEVLTADRVLAGKDGVVPPM
jgi:hypothetical protein